MTDQQWTIVWFVVTAAWIATSLIVGIKVAFND